MNDTLYQKDRYTYCYDVAYCTALADGFTTTATMQQTLEGLWDEWTDPSSDITRKTYTILTTSANPTMARIHNNPKASEEPRVPLILPKGLELDWLKPINHKVDMDFIESLIQPYDEEELDTFTVKRLSGHRENKARYFRLPTELLIIHNP